MKKLLLFLLLGSIHLSAELSPKDALERLIKGNERYTQDQFMCPDRTQIRRLAVASKQKPFAAIVGCADSRVPPEILFDQGVGDLFVVRVAGNVVGPVELDSIDYATVYLGASLVVVLGHESCGAVDAVLANTTKDIEAVAALIAPNIKMSHSVDEAVKANVRQTVKNLKNSRVLSRLIKEGKVNVVGGYYELKSGKVEILESDTAE